VREPSGDAWVKFREFLTPPELPEGEEPVKLTSAQEFMRNKDADVILFIDVLLDEEVTAFFLMMIHRLSRNLWTGTQAPAECRSCSWR
jgi:hypothetical protein